MVRDVEAALPGKTILLALSSRAGRRAEGSRSIVLRSVLARNPSPMTLDGTRTYLLGDREVLVIDPGPADERHVEAVLREIRDARTIGIVVTHHHADHSGGADSLARTTGAPILVGPVPGITPADGVTLQPLNDGERLVAEVGEVTVIATPGHTPDHIALEWRNEGASGPVTFVGDLLLGRGDTAFVGAPEGDVGEYLASLQRVEERAPRALYPAHGPPLDDPAAAIRRFRDHRLQRVEQVRRARLQLPEATENELVDHIYGESLDGALRGAAAASVRAILQYLARS